MVNTKIRLIVFFAAKFGEALYSQQKTRSGLDLIDRVPDELWTEVRDIVQETGLKTIPKKKKCKKEKWLTEEALQIAVKREVKSKGENERYTIRMQSSKE